MTEEQLTQQGEDTMAELEAAMAADLESDGDDITIGGLEAPADDDSELWAVDDEADDEADDEGVDYQAAYEDMQQQLATRDQAMQTMGNVVQMLYQRYAEQRDDDVELARIVQQEAAQAALPNPLEGPEQLVNWMDQRFQTQEQLIQAQHQERIAAQQAQQQQAQQQALVTALQQADAAAVQTWDYYPEVEQFAVAGLQRQLRAAFQDPAQAPQLLQQIKVNALMQGINPAEQVFQFAYTLGYQPPEYGDEGGVEEEEQAPTSFQDPAYAARSKRAAQTNARSRQPRSSSTPKTGLTKRQVASMNEEDIMPFMDPESPQFDPNFFDKWIQTARGV